MDGDVDLGVVDGAGVDLGVEYERDGLLGVVLLGVENDLLPDEKPPLDLVLEKPRDFAKAGPASIPRANTIMTTRVSIRLTQAEVRIGSLPRRVSCQPMEFRIFSLNPCWLPLRESITDPKGSPEKAKK